MASRSSRPVFSRTDPASNAGEASRISSAGSLERPRVGVTGVDQLEGGALESFGRAASGFLMFSPSAATPTSPGRTKRRADRRSVVLPAVVRLALVAARRFLQRARRSIRPYPRVRLSKLRCPQQSSVPEKMGLRPGTGTSAAALSLSLPLGAHGCQWAWSVRFLKVGRTGLAPKVS